MKKSSLILALLILCTALQAKDKLHMLLKGSMNDKMPIRMYLSIGMDECSGENVFKGMYKYDGVSEWLPLDIHSNDHMQIVMVELGFTGLMILTYENLSLKGYWYSPDNQKKLKLYLNKVDASENELEELSKTYAEKWYEYVGC